MPDRPSPEEVGKWHRWFAIECNNRAWTLAEAEQRSNAEDAELLACAYSAAYHWSQVGTAENAALAEMLLAQAHALLGHGDLALHYARRTFDWVAANSRPDWEVAFAHAILANAAHAAGDGALHAEHYAIAKLAGDALGAEDKAIFDATFRLIPPP